MVSRSFDAVKMFENITLFTKLGKPEQFSVNIFPEMLITH